MTNDVTALCSKVMKYYLSTLSKANIQEIKDTERVIRLIDGTEQYDKDYQRPTLCRGFKVYIEKIGEDHKRVKKTKGECAELEKINQELKVCEELRNAFCNIRDGPISGLTNSNIKKL